MSSNNETAVGTVGGTLLSIVPNIQSADVVKTIVLATVGAIVSFTVSLILKCVIRRHRK